VRHDEAVDALYFKRSLELLLSASVVHVLDIV
jgi:hypothetical protein